MSRYYIILSRLSKRELEDLYFALLDNNLELKQTINNQNEKIKQLSTRVQRLSAVQRTSLSRSERDCCTSGKAVIREQNQIIADQKRANDRLSERVKILNMRLCSAKQFLGRNSARCNKCCLGTNISVKNSTISATLNSANKRSASNLQTTIASNEIIHKELPQTTSVEVQTDHLDADNGEKVCNENKCKTLMEELKQKIVALEEELSKAHEEHSKRVERLEREVLTLRQSKSEKLLTLQQSEEQMGQLMQRLRAAEMKCDDINLQLSVEKRKVSELETRLKAADLSAHVAKTVERHLMDHNLHAKCETLLPLSDKLLSADSSDQRRTKVTQEQPKNSDDSGYMDTSLFDERKSPAKDVTKELREKIFDLQSQLNSLKRLAAVDKDIGKRVSNFEPYELAIEADQVSILKSITDYNLMRSSPFVPEPNRTKSGEVFEIKRPESFILQENGQDTLDAKMSHVTDTSNTSETVKSKSDLLESKGISDKPEEFQKARKKDEKMSKNVSYEDVILNSEKSIVKGTLGECGEFHTLLRHASSDEKHNAKINELSSTNNVIEKISTKRGNRDEHVKLSDDYHIRGSHTNITDKRQTAEKKFECDITPTDDKDLNSSREYASRSCSKEENKGIMNKEQVAKGSRIYSAETKTAFRSKSVPEKALIEIIKSDSSTDKIPKSPNVASFTHKLEEFGDIKVLKEVKPSSEIDLTEFEKVEKGKKKKSIVGHGLTTEKNQRRGKSDLNGPAEKIVEQDHEIVDSCQCRARVCPCPLVRRREVNVFRTCSGTARFETVTTAVRPFERCACCSKNVQRDRNVARGSRTPQRRSSSGGGTYVVRGAPSPVPADTDGEISGLTDLPDERDESPRNILSPGEERPTYTETHTSTTDITLSEGELPVSCGARKPLSPGERKWKNSSGEISPAITSSRRMEEALQAVGEELARCRQMLQRQRPQQASSKGVSPMTVSASDTIALSKVVSQARIVPEHAHSCRFTFHVGTLVLSDQAVAYSRGKSLLLAWRFYDQQQSMVRMSPGRVLHFDFTMEYRLPLTEHFLDYLRREVMPITIYEMQRPEEALASCSMPLCGALGRANRRVYLSLTLVAGSEMLGSRHDFDELDSGDEVGVLDVWCRLKVGPGLLGTVRRASHQSPDVTATPSLTNGRPCGSSLTQENSPRREIEQKIVVSSAQDLRRKIAHEIQSPSKMRVLLEVGAVDTHGSEDGNRRALDITVMWIALNEECEAMTRTDVQRLFVAYSFLGRDGADLETPVSLPKPKDCREKCHFNFKKIYDKKLIAFQLRECDLPLLGHMAKCRRRRNVRPSHRDCLTFTVISEPSEDPLGLNSCEDIGYARLYLGDVLDRCFSSDSYTDVVSVRGVKSNSACGVLAVRIAGLRALKRMWRCASLPQCRAKDVDVFSPGFPAYGDCKVPFASPHAIIDLIVAGTSATEPED
ncbi:unnamed protein product, partial [Iphiclides podalirius]